MNIILFHIIKYPLDSALLVISTILFAFLLRKISSSNFIQKTFGFFILAYVFLFWGDAIATSGGTGSFIGPDIVLTNHHVVNNSCSAIKIINNGKEYEGEYIDGINKNGVDLSYVKVNNIQKRYFLKVSDTKAALGEKVFFPDYDQNNLGVFTVSTGFVKNYLSSGEFRFESNNARPGNSGSPILNQYGNLVGVLWGGNWINHFVHSKGVGGNGVSNSLDWVINIAKKNNIALHTSSAHTIFSKQSIKRLIDNVSVSIICQRPI
ncbi:MAG: trypsin-like peptidase domain-containing protein [Rickettsiales bacterium]|nr:trypsin-like peptidase domain-containing protein [Rickettsiales bacterium]